MKELGYSVNIILGNQRHAFRRWSIIPNVGDKLELNSGIYKVAERIFLYEDTGEQQKFSLVIEKL